MVRTSKLLLWSVVTVVSVLIPLAYAGMLESVITPDRLPGPPAAGFVAPFPMVVLGFLVSAILDRRAWKRTGNEVGLTAGGRGQFDSGPPEESDKATLTGIVNGRPVRARTYSTGGGRNSSSTTYTVVEAELNTPVEWEASFDFSGTTQAPDDPGVDAAKTQTVDGIGVRGDVSEDVARAVLTQRAREALRSVEGPISVGDLKATFVNDMLDELDGAGGIAGTLAEGILNVASDGEVGPSRTVHHRSEGLLTDETVLQRRIEAVTAVADAVDQTG